MLAFDPGALLWVLRKAACEVGGQYWSADVEGFEPFAALSAGLALDAVPPKGPILNIAVGRNKFVALLEHYNLPVEQYVHDGVGIVTATVQRIVFNAPADMVRVRRIGSGGGYHIFVAVPSKEAWVFDILSPFSPAIDVPGWAPARHRRTSVTSIPIEDGRLWVVPTPKVHRFELFALARQTVASSKELEFSSRWGSVLLPVVSVAAKFKLKTLAGATLSGSEAMLMDAFQVLGLQYDTSRFGRASAPKAAPDELPSLVYNQPVMVFKTGPDDAIQWLYHAGVFDWDVFGAK